MIRRLLNEFDSQSTLMPVIMGATATGKSALAFELARALNGEVVSVDSMQFYRGLDIGTAKPSKEEQKCVPHHLLDILELHEKSDIFSFKERIDSVIREIRRRGRLPIVVGGSGLYLHAFIYGIDPLPQSEEIRNKLNGKYDNDAEFPALKALMQQKCPEDFQRFHADRRKLIRAYEIFLLTGKQISELQLNRRNLKPREDVRSFVLSRDRDVLKNRIRSRCEKMLCSGWIEETERLLPQGLLTSPTARQAIGYSLIADYLAGKISREELPVRIATSTWQFARRQITWFKHQHTEAELLEPGPEA